MFDQSSGPTSALKESPHGAIAELFSLEDPKSPPVSFILTTKEAHNRNNLNNLVIKMRLPARRQTIPAAKPPALLGDRAKPAATLSDKLVR